MTTDATPAERHLVVLEGVEKRFGARLAALSGIDVAIGRGEHVRVEGPSGAGKTTLLRLIAALDAPTSGHVAIAGRRVESLAAPARARLRNTIGILLHEPVLPSRRSVLAAVAVGATIAGAPDDEAEQRAIAALTRVGLDPATLGRIPCRELPRGEARRVAFARALVNRPALLVLDDPGAGLDAPTGASLQALLEQFAAAGVTVVASAPSGVPLAPATPHMRILRLESGRLAR
ncbi:MAG TPA: ATP-binding cassette domain-containing protein [Burkholderiaceae bacterium]|nr:ATP-binding cassette domain-containing protein [Burkholderiaceae bacterium]